MGFGKIKSVKARQRFQVKKKKETRTSLLLFSCTILGIIFVFSGAIMAEDGKEVRKQISQGEPCSLPPDGAILGDGIVMGSIGEPGNLISGLSSDSASGEVTSRLYVGLLKYDENLEIVADAAESFEILDGGLRLRFILRQGLKWSDGHEMDADDVEFTYRLMIDPGTPTAYAGDYLRVKEFRKLGQYSFEVTYDKPFARSLITWMRDILPRRALQGENLRDTKYSRNPVASGPFLLKEWVAGTRLILTANRNYFEGRPYVDGIIYRVIPDLSTMFWELKAGKIDLMGLSPQQSVYQTKERAFSDNFAVYNDLAHGYTYLAYNLESPLFKDMRVRQAFAYAINKKDIISGALFEQGVPAFGPYRPGSWAYNDKITQYPFNQERAKTLLAECGWVSGSDGILIREGRRFSFTVLVNQGNEQRIKTAVIIQSQLKQIGVEVKIRAVEWAAFLSDFVHKGYFDALILGWNITHDPDIYDVWHSSRAFAGGLNFIKYGNEEVDALLEEARSTFDRTLRKRCYDRIQEILHDEQPYCFLYVPYNITAVHKRFENVRDVPAGITHNIIRWWTLQEKQLYRNLLQQ